MQRHDVGKLYDTRGNAEVDFEQLCDSFVEGQVNRDSCRRQTAESPIVMMLVGLWEKQMTRKLLYDFYRRGRGEQPGL